MKDSLKNASLVGLLTGTITGYCKYSNLSTKEAKYLVSQLLWCYEKVNIPVPPSVKEDIEKILAS